MSFTQRSRHKKKAPEREPFNVFLAEFKTYDHRRVHRERPDPVLCIRLLH